MMDPDHRLLLRSALPLLQSRNAAVRTVPLSLCGVGSCSPMVVWRRVGSVRLSVCLDLHLYIHVICMDAAACFGIGMDFQSPHTPIARRISVRAWACKRGPWSVYSRDPPWSCPARANAQVLLAVAQVFHYVGPHTEFGAVTRAIVHILRNHREVEFVVLSSIIAIAQTRKAAFEPYLKSFFIRSVNSGSLVVRLLRTSPVVVVVVGVVVCCFHRRSRRCRLLSVVFLFS